jgi:hypothetical protein
MICVVRVTHQYLVGFRVGLGDSWLQRVSVKRCNQTDLVPSHVRRWNVDHLGHRKLNSF